MRVLRIDPKEASVKSYELPSRDGEVNNKDIYAALDCHLMQYLYLSKHVLLIIDEEGLRKWNYHWAFNDRGQHAIAGKGILCGFDPDEGNMMPVPPKVTEREVAEQILWLGTDQSFEKMIKAGRYERPKQQMFAGNEPPVTLWEWTPHDRPKQAT